MGKHLLEGFIRLVGVLEHHDFYFVKLVYPVEPPHMGAIRAGLPAETRGIGRHLNREVALIEDGIPVNIRDWHLGCGD